MTLGAPLSEVSQREFFEAKLKAQRELFDSKLDGLERRFDETINAIEKAKEIQAIEYKRRLEELNHEKERLVQQKSDTVSREIWDRFQAEYNLWKQSYEVRHTEVVTRRENDQRRKEIDDRMEASRAEFLAYKEETRREVDIAKGQSKGLMLAWGAVLAALTIIANLASAYFKRL